MNGYYFPPAINSAKGPNWTSEGWEPPRARLRALRAIGATQDQSHVPRADNHSINGMISRLLGWPLRVKAGQARAPRWGCSEKFSSVI